MTLEELTQLLEAKAAALRAAVVDLVEKKTANTEAAEAYSAAQNAYATAKSELDNALAQLLAL